MNASLNQLKNDKTVFYVQPTLMVGSTVESNVSKPEDFAFASAVRTGTKADNYGNANLMRNGADFSVYINTAQEFDGSDAGARPDEAVSWGKIKVNAKSVKIYAEVTLVFPIIVAETFARYQDKASKVSEVEEIEKKKKEEKERKRKQEEKEKLQKEKQEKKN